MIGISGSIFNYSNVLRSNIVTTQVTQFILSCSIKTIPSPTPPPPPVTAPTPTPQLASDLVEVDLDPICFKDDLDLICLKMIQI